MVYLVYNFVLTVALLASLPLLPFFYLFGGRLREGLWQRLGFYSPRVIEGLRGSRPVWIHAVSVGEALSAKHLAWQLKRRDPGRKIVLSTFTATGKEVARQAVPADRIIFFPLDHPWVVRRALDLIDPCALIFLEAEIWPNLLRSAYRRGIPTLLLSGRLSERSFRRYSLLRPFFSTVVRYFTAVGMQTEEDADRMVRLGGEPGKVWVTGNLKQCLAEGEALSLPWVGAEGRPVLVVGSTHRGEEEILLDAYLTLKPQFPRLLMVLAPRHPQRFPEVERLLQKRGVLYERRSRMNGNESEPPDVIFLDTLGDLPRYYAVADVAFVGGSLVDAGGHNLLEPARFRKPVLFGPYMSNFTEIAQEMKRRGGGIEVRGRDDLVREIARLLADRAAAEKVGGLAYGVAEGDQGVGERTMNLVSRYL